MRTASPLCVNFVSHYVLGLKSKKYQFSYDTKNNSWLTLQPMNTGRCNASAVVMDGIIYVGGGVDCTGRTGRSFESYDPTTFEWAQLAATNHAHFNFTLVESNGNLYALGSQLVIEKYEPVANRWTQACFFTTFDTILCFSS